MKEPSFLGDLVSRIPRELVLLMIAGMAVFLLCGLFIVDDLGRYALLCAWLVWSACCVSIFAGRRSEGKR